MSEQASDSKVRVMHNIIMENRRRLSVSGITDVDAFDELEITAQSSLGVLTVRGRELRITNYSKDTGDLDIEGDICELSYTEPKPETHGVFARLFK